MPGISLAQELSEEQTQVQEHTITITLQQIKLVRYFIVLILTIMAAGYFAGRAAMNYEDRLMAIERYIAKKEAATPAISDATYVAQPAHYNFHH